MVVYQNLNLSGDWLIQVDWLLIVLIHTYILYSSGHSAIVCFA